MIATWMLYGIAASLLLGVAALAADRAARLLRWSLRWIWVGSLWGSVLLPPALVYSARDTHRWSGVEQWVQARRTDTPEPAQAPGARPAVRRPTFSLDWLDRPLLVAWLLASLGVCMTMLAGLLSITRARRHWRAAFVGETPVLISPDVGPAVGPFWGDSIVLPEWTLAVEPKLQRLIVTHEREHLRARDPHTLLQALLPLVLVPWNLPLWWQVRRLRLAIEMDCDARVLRRDTDVAAYGELLLVVSRRAVRRSPVPIAAFSEGPTSLEARIRMMTSSRPPRYLLTVTALTLGAVFPLVATSALPQPAFRPTARPAALAPQDTDTQAAPGAVRRSFRNLVIAQEAYFASHHAYAADLAKLPDYRPEPGVRVALVWAGTWAGKSGWRGAVSAPGSRRNCAIYFWLVHSDDQSATDLEKTTGEKAEPACEGDGQPATNR